MSVKVFISIFSDAVKKSLSQPFQKLYYQNSKKFQLFEIFFTSS